MKTSLAALAAALLAIPAAHAEEADKPKWDVAAPPGMTTRKVPVDTDEGTWMNLDVSPDGRTIAFDLLGDIYTMPITGGTATRIAEGLPFEIQPRFSPDGRRIAFTSDRGGGDNIWVMNRDGSDKRQVSKEDFRLLNNPSWSPDGRFIAARKHFTTERSAGTGEIWLYHVSGGSGVALVKRASEQLQKELGEPAFTPDGEGIYYSRNITPGPVFEYAQDSNTDLFDIERYDLDTGKVETVVSGAGGAVRATPSPDGKWLAFVRRERARSKLYVKDLKSGTVRKVYDKLDLDMQETWAVQGLYPNMAWLPDSRALVVWAGGRLRRIDMASGADTIIPFRVTDDRVVIDPVRPQVAVAPDSFATRMPRFASVSPDGRQILFETMGKLWLKPAAGGAARRLTRGDEELELFPNWSRDGRQIVYVGWTDAGLGTIRTIAAAGGQGKAVTTEPGHYRRPRFSPDGKTIVFEKGKGGQLTSADHSDSSGVFRVATAGGEVVRVTADGGEPQFGAANDRLFVTRFADGKGMLVSLDLNGEAARTHATGELVSNFSVAPTGEYFAFRESYGAYVMPLLPGNQEIGAGAKGSPLPVTRASAGGADYVHWGAGGRALHWSLGPTFYTAQTASLFPSAPPPPAGTPSAPAYVPPATGISLSMDVAARKHQGRVALVGARIVTMAAADGGIVEDGAVLIDGDRIAAIGPRAGVTIPAGTKTIDVGGKTIIPGLIDAHAHGPQGVDEIVPQQNWSAIAHLALGVTTVHDPSSTAAEIFPASERQRVNDFLAPRIFSTGEVVYGAKAGGFYARIDSIDDARAHVRRLKAQGAHAIKNYNQPRREQRQQVVAASIESNIATVAEGGALFGMDIALIADGNTTLEHNIPQNIFYKDVVDFFAATKVGYTPTLVVSYSGLAGDPYWRQATDVWLHPILSRHVPPGDLQARNVRRTKAPEEDFVDDDNAREAHKLARRGVMVSIGAHGQEEGLGSHWELWSFVRGGMTPLEALRAGTINPARSLGFDRDIGSLEAGKLADLVVLDADPLTDIRNSDHIARVMLGGRLYDPLTMDEVETGTAKKRRYFWE